MQVHPHRRVSRFPALLLSLLLMLAPACAEKKPAGTTTPATNPGDMTAAADPAPGEAPGEDPVTEDDPGTPGDDPEAVADDPVAAEDPAEDPEPAAPEVTTPAAAPPVADGTLSAEEKALFDYHNKVRADVSVAPLVWSDKLKGVAAAWGQKLVAKGCVMEHSKGSGYGENLYMGSAEYFTMLDAAKSWESEKKHYTGAPLNGSNWYKSGHYTQMVWRKTTEVGCAKVTCKGSLIVICNYNPPGNFMGEKAY